MSAVAAVAVASPFAVIAITDMSNPAPQQREFKQAAVVTDLPNELMSALQQGLSQFGINLPPLPTGLSPAGTQPITGAALTSPSLITPALGSPAPALTTPGLTGLPATGVTTPALPGDALASPSLTNPALTNPALTNPALTSPLGTPALPTTAGLTDPALGALAPASTGLGFPNEQAISAPIGLDPLAGTYPIDPSLAGPMPAAGGGGLISDLSSAAQQLGAGQAIDLLKGVLMPSIMSAVQSAAPAAQAAATAPAAPAAEAVAAAVPAAG
jgi:hypothetical protein